MDREGKGRRVVGISAEGGENDDAGAVDLGAESGDARAGAGGYGGGTAVGDPGWGRVASGPRDGAGGCGPRVP